MMRAAGPYFATLDMILRMAILQLPMSLIRRFASFSTIDLQFRMTAAFLKLNTQVLNVRAARTLLLAATLVIAGMERAAAAQYGDFTYSTGAGNATITGYTGPGGDVAIPANINGYRVAYIGGYAFFGNTAITSINFSGSVISIQPSAFFFCANLVSINVDPANSQLNSVDGVLFDKSQHLLIQCPAGKSGGYTIPATVSTIQSDAFTYCDKLTQIIVPASVTSIGNQAFDYAMNIGAIYFLGNAPGVYASGFASSSATVFYLPGTIGWGSTFAGRPTMLWNPRIQIADSDFGMRTNGFSFNITGTSNLTVVIEASGSLAQPGWIAIGTNTLINGAASFTDPESKSFSSRYYRLRSP